VINKCSGCNGKCCVGVIEIYEDDEVYSNPILTKEIECEYYNQVMRTTMDNKCIAFEDDKCTIYEKRPWVCKSFGYDSECCKKFRNGERCKHICRDCHFLEERINYEINKTPDL
jgi:Fe-S-cluster containining protein